MVEDQTPTTTHICWSVKPMLCDGAMECHGNRILFVDKVIKAVLPGNIFTLKIYKKEFNGIFSERQT